MTSWCLLLDLLQSMPELNEFKLRLIAHAHACWLAVRAPCDSKHRLSNASDKDNYNTLVQVGLELFRKLKMPFFQIGVSRYSRYSRIRSE